MADNSYITIGGDTSKYEAALRNVKSESEKFVGTVKKHWLEIASAIYSANKAWESIKGAARAQQEEQAFRNLAVSYKANADQIVSDLKRASAETVDTVSLVRQAGTAMMMGISPEHLTGLMEIARATSRQTGQDVSKSFDDITLAVSRQSKQILDNLGIIVQVEQANDRYARKIGKTTEQLTEAEKKQAFLTETMRAGQELMGRLGDQGITAAESIQSLEAWARNLANTMGTVLLESLRYTVWGFTQLGIIGNRTFEQISGGWGMIFDLLGKLPGGEMLGFKSFGEQLGGLSEHFQKARQEGEKFAELVWNLKTSAGPGMGIAPSPGPVGSDQARIEELAELDKEILRSKWQEIMEIQRGEYAAWFMSVSEGDQALRDYQAKLDGEQMQRKMEEYRILGEQEAAMYDLKGNLHRKWVIDAAALDEQRKREQQQGVKSMLGNWSYFFKEMGKEHSGAFKAYKAVAVAETVIDTYQAAMAAYKSLAGIEVVGPALGTAAAAAAVAAGMARVHSILSTEPGTTAAGGGAGEAVGVYSANPTTGLPENIPYGADGAGVGRSSLTIVLEGDMVTDDAYMDRLVERINEGVRTRNVTLYATHSRSAERVN